MRYINNSKQTIWVSSQSPGLITKGTPREWWVAYLISQGATGETLHDLEASFLSAQGITGKTIHDRWSTYLVGLGYTAGPLRSKFNQWMSNLNPPVSYQTVATTNLATSGSSTDATSYVATSIAPTAGRLYLAFVYTIAAAAPNIPTMTGNGLTWAQTATSTDGSVRRLTAFQATGTPSAGSPTFDFGGQTQTGCIWSIVEVSGTPLTSNGSDAIAQLVSSANPATNDRLEITLGAFTRAANATLGAFGYPLNAGTGDKLGSFTVVGERFQGTPNMAVLTEFAADNQATVGATWTPSSVPAIGIALELNAAVV